MKGGTRSEAGLRSMVEKEEKEETAQLISLKDWAAAISGQFHEGENRIFLRPRLTLHYNMLSRTTKSTTDKTSNSSTGYTFCKYTTPATQ